MKYLFFLIFSLGLLACGGKKDVIKPLFELDREKNYMASVDSVIFKHEHGIVYITSDTTAEMYDWLSNTEIDTILLQAYFGSKNNIQPFNLNSFPKNWSPIHLYKNEYFVYSPSDWIASANVLVTDSVVYYLSSDWNSYEIEKFDKNGNLYLFETTGPYSSEKGLCTVRYIDEKKGIAEWKFENLSDGVYINELRVESDKVRNFRMIVNDCLGQKCLKEFEFDEDMKDSSSLQIRK